MKSRTLCFAGILTVALACGALQASAAEYYLRAGIGTATMPDGTPIQVWGFALKPESGGSNVVTVPGPRLTVPPGDTQLTVHLENTLAEPVSLVIVGQAAVLNPVRFTDAQGRQRVKSFTHEAAPGASADYTWSNVQPGTYLYHSGSHVGLQVPLGLYGAMTKDFAAGEAYEGVPYAAEVLLFYSSLDPALNEAVQLGTYGTPAMPSTIDMAPQYFLINGAPFQQGVTPPLATAPAGQRTLLRILNTSVYEHAPLLVGTSMTIVAEDGHQAPWPKRQTALNLGAGKTYDAIFQPLLPGTYPIFDRRLYLSDAGAATPGGMLRFLQAPALVNSDNPGAVTEEASPTPVQKPRRPGIGGGATGTQSGERR